MTTNLGLPPLPPRTSAPPWRSAWDAALYGEGGFYRTTSPAAHFRTSAHGPSGVLAEGVVALLRRHGLTRLVDVGAGRGELLRAVHALDPSLDLLGVELAPRPHDLPASVAWDHQPPAQVHDGLLLAHEWLDNVPCHVVEVDRAGVPRLVHVDPVTGEESTGHAVDAAGVPASIGAWLGRWWPLTGAAPGTRAEVGTTRDAAWAAMAARVRSGIAVAVDYGHLRESRPPSGSLRSFRGGRLVDAVPDGSCDVTAHVAVDAVAAAVEGRVLTQAEALADLGVSATRPSLALAEESPRAYAAALAAATEAADLMHPGGLGGFYWVVSRTDG